MCPGSKAGRKVEVIGGFGGPNPVSRLLHFGYRIQDISIQDTGDRILYRIQDKGYSADAFRFPQPGGPCMQGPADLLLIPGCWDLVGNLICLIPGCVGT